VTECLNMFLRSEKLKDWENAMKPDQRDVDEHPLESVKGRAMNSRKKQGDGMGCTMSQRRTGFD